MKHAIRSGALSTLLLVSLGCSADRQPVAPGLVAARSVQSAPKEIACGFPTLDRPGRVYTYTGSPFPTVADGTRCSRFLLYDDGRFDLQFGTTFSYRGTYRVSNNVVDFRWDGWSAAGAWGSDATLDGDTLTVRYNVIMQMTDFEDAVYRLAN